MRLLRFVVSVVVTAAAAACDCGKNVVIQMNEPTIFLESNELDFGPVTEFTDAGRSIVVTNNGLAPLGISSVTIEQDGGEFTVARLPGPIGVSGTGNIEIDFSPLGAGDDYAVAVISSDDPKTPTVRVNLHGGPIYPSLAFDPDGGFLTFVPTSMALTSKYAVLRSVGGSSLTVTSVGVAPTGNPDFSVVRPALPAVLRPGQGLPVQVDYSRSSRNTEGIMSVNSDDPDAGRRTLRLIPDPAAQCSDQLDNDMDGLADFPDDPGCSNGNDSDEYNDPECVDGAMRSCGSTIGICRAGTQTCMNGAFFPCDGGVRPGMESCNGLDDNCSGVTDEDIIETCTINGCPGARRCVVDSGVPGGAYGTCFPVMATQEACNGVDDDCDGQADENIVETCNINGCLGERFCLPVPMGQTRDGGVYTMCAPSNPATETCNGIDDNCDGTIDNVMPQVQTCGFGVCARTVPACVDGGIPACVPGMGGMEICNGIDDDCDGTPDDNLGNLTCGVGACGRTVPMCLADGGTNVCVPGMQMPETCNNADDDCDMATDEQADGGPLTQACFTVTMAQRNVGRCRDGTQVCSMGSFGGGCPGEVTPTLETCNNIDDDCDGPTDEGLSVVCYDAGSPATRNVGRCRDGMAACTLGVYGNCNGQIGPIPEVCGNSIDDNCAGGVDDGCTIDGGCVPTGNWIRDGGAMAYSCAFGIVSFSISSFQFLSNGAQIVLGGADTNVCGASIPANVLPGAPTTCPSGSFNNSCFYGGSCDETYTLTGMFVGPNEWRGTFTADFVGSCLGCTTRTFPVQAFRQ